MSMHHDATIMLKTPSSSPITSKGCSRGFILCVLYRALDYVRQRQMLGHTVQFPFCNEEISRWLLVSSSCHRAIDWFRRFQTFRVISSTTELQHRLPKETVRSANNHSKTDLAELTTMRQMRVPTGRSLNSFAHGGKTMWRGKTNFYSFNVMPHTMTPMRSRLRGT